MVVTPEAWDILGSFGALVATELEDWDPVEQSYGARAGLRHQSQAVPVEQLM